MSGWDTYVARMNARGMTRQEVAHKREARFIKNRLPNNLSYTTALLYPMEFGYNIDDDDMDGYAIKQKVAIIDSDNLNEKKMISMPGEDIELGSLVSWMDQYWLVTERDANTTVYTRTKLLQCNHLLHWIDPETNEIMSQWCVIEDGTKYLTGELEDWPKWLSPLAQRCA